MSLTSFLSRQRGLNVFGRAASNLKTTQKDARGTVKAAEKNYQRILLKNARIRAKQSRMLLPPMRRGQGILFFTLIMAIIFIVFFLMLSPSLQNFADGFVASNPTAPTEVQALAKIAPFGLLLMVFVGVIAAVGMRPSIGGF